MSEFRIRVRPNGPLVIEGAVTVVDHLGQAFFSNSEKPFTALCRCGQSANKPFCDGAHKRIGFAAEETAGPASPPASDA